jgi:hypothetical protein
MGETVPFGYIIIDKMRLVNNYDVMLCNLTNKLVENKVGFQGNFFFFNSAKMIRINAHLHFFQILNSTKLFRNLN